VGKLVPSDPDPLELLPDRIPEPSSFSFAMPRPGREIRVAMQLASYLALQFLMHFFVYHFAALLRKNT
jgi:hypothetical protein